jgi:cytochrome c oxidase assembly protein subunit 11
MAFNLIRYNRQLLLKLIVISSAMFVFGYALIPMYRVLCEVTGINVVTSKNDYGTRAVGAVNKNTQIDQSRLITVEFDSNTQGPFRFRSVKNSMQVHPGEMIQVIYEVVNTQGRSVSAQAIPSYAPKQATQHFTKLECFCFEQQTLKPNESREMPVVFVIDPALPKDVKNITLSYTFFEVGSGQKVITGEHNSKPSKI